MFPTKEKKKKNLFEESEVDSQEEELFVDKFSQNDLFQSKNGKIFFELQKSFGGDSRFKMDDRFKDDIQENLLPESVKLNFLRKEK